jgi:hypothetical protein
LILDLIQNEGDGCRNVAMIVLWMDQSDLSMNVIDRSFDSGHTGAFHPEQVAPPLAQHDSGPPVLQAPTSQEPR